MDSGEHCIVMLDVVGIGIMQIPQTYDSERLQSP
jgi:hypothetical protein